ncbi:hypothetical protein SAMN02982917_0576 [Azospirillum oryzae]|uniref:Uncharacterized protein n=1 Tax=Azospirillum oryzae TaxID=286727 RepID=A0A1X7HTU3_9PROT|nr:hypothetical protein SAMN02982917_0576 [Azospirillum oryzae]
MAPLLRKHHERIGAHLKLNGGVLDLVSKIAHGAAELRRAGVGGILRGGSSFRGGSARLQVRPGLARRLPGPGIGGGKLRL